MPYEAKTNWKYDDTVTEKDLNRIEQGLKDAHVAEYKDITLKPGVQIVDVPEDTPFRMGEIRGRTLINLLGHAGRCDDMAPWGMWQASLDTDSSFKGLRVDVQSGYDDGAAFIGIKNVQNGRSFIIVGNAEHNVNAQGARFGATFYTGDKVVDNTVVSKKTSETSVRQPIHLVFTIPSGVNSFTVNMGVVANEAKARGYFDSVRVYEIPSSEVVRLTSMKSEDVAELYPYTESITNVTNPYAIATSGNLLPPFTEWGESAQLALSVSSPYEIRLSKTSSNEFATKTISLSLPPNTAFTFSTEVEADFLASGTYGAYLNVFSVDSTETVTSIELKTTAYRNTSGAFSIFSDFTVPSNSNKIRILVGVDAQSTGNFIFKNPMLIPGDKPQPFMPESCSMWAAECQLASNPADGSNADVLFAGEDGLPYVLEKWNKVVLDGSLKWEHDNAATYKGFKRIRVPVASGVPYSQYVVKFDGKILPNINEGVNWETADLSQLYKNEHLYLSISNEDSGWSDSYTPTADEIKAYFLGWKMYDGVNGKNPYTSGTRAWCYRESADSYTGGTNTLPTTTAPNWTPYRLQYIKSKPTIEHVRNYETGLTLSKAWNMVEVGSGIVIRESTKPTHYLANGNYYINNTAVNGSLLKNKVSHILRVYRNGSAANTAKIENDANAYGKQHIRFLPSDFDTTAVYHVTYTILDPTLSAPIVGSIATNLRGTVTDMVSWVSDAERRLSVVETKKAENDTKLHFIKPTLLNDWKLFGESGRPEAGYCKDRDGFVYLKGVITGGTVGVTGKPAFFLPVGYRPKRLLSKIAITTLSSNAAVDIAADGGVYIITGDNYFIALDTISPFLAEQ
ncbi:MULTISPECIES: hypothetical protein [unclassified Paenibacillus]|uniref:hypothetical protein n=1 Tax=unclassified Paenibacillus TaxID=185978 RepID=UPI00048B5D6E|nr:MULTISPECIES: hypothetical protein [unclassified Paenibacillus]SDE33688.1 hypothetical protein SAMN04488689_101136 [Paenibacillus sp. cl6col]